MFIDGLNAGEKIQIRVEKGTSTMDFTTEVVHVSSEVEILAIQQQERKLHIKILPVKLITDSKTGTPISFPEGNIIYKVCVIRDKTPYIWRRITIRRIDKTPFHILLSNEDAQPTDRRTSPRVSLGIQGTARFLNGAGTLPVTIKNISGSGIAVVVEPSVNPGAIKAGSLIQDVTFTDPELDETFVLSAFVVRTTKYNTGRVLYGCKLNSKTTEVTSYVNHKLYLQQNGGSGLSIDE